MNLAPLEQLGLTEKEADLYTILLKEGALFMHELEKKTPYKRGDLYNIVASLEEWGLIEGIEAGKRTKYEAAHPSRLQEMVREQEQSIEENKKQLGAVMGQFMGLYNLQHHKPGIQVLEGKEGFEEALFQSLSAKEEIYTIADVRAALTYAPEINKRYTKKREALGVQNKLLVANTTFAKEFFFQNKAKLKHVNYKFLPEDTADKATSIQIYDGKVVYMTLREENAMAVIIEDPHIYAMQRHAFEALWNSLS